MALDFDWGRLRRLDPEAVRYIVVHTQGSPSNADSSAAAIHAFHKAPLRYDEKGNPLGRGWAGIGYHKVVRKNGAVEPGRPEMYIGSHVEGLNYVSVGICCSGNGDIEDFTDEQYASVAREIHGWMKWFPHTTLGRVLGHAECYKIPGVKDLGKSCPGRKVSMERIRAEVARLILEEMPDVEPKPARIVRPPKIITEPFTDRGTG